MWEESGLAREGATMRSRPGAVVRWVVATLLIAVCPPPVHAFHTVFHYQVERMVIDGNIFGAHDGTPDKVEEFDGPTLPPPFTPFLGTVSVSGGALHLQSPGTHFDIPELGLELDMSDVISSGAPLLRDAAGSGRIEVHFRPATLGLNHFVHATLMVNGPGGDGRFIGLA